ncbi:MAG TPA: helix-turn-helix transcriptional regulator, partial [Solirubrobacteraceae bacterium]|nr:helix-turn-helix transcriptional regulator [Solirubrobacteraceae bacterium]
AGATASRLAPRLQQLAARCGAPLPDAYAAHATAKARADGDRLLEVSRDLEAIGALRYAAEAAADAASSHLAAGRHDSARRAAARSRALHAPGEGGTAPEIDGLGGVDIALTARERQLTEFAARGMSNADIANQLVISIRTVESHLYRAMRKLGINDRRDLAAFKTTRTMTP